MEHFIRNQEGLQCYVRQWPVAEPKAVIALVHGQGEHIGRYEHLGRWFNAHDIALIGIDLQGYGKSEGKRGHFRHLDNLLDDIGLLLQESRALYPRAPLFLYGHSMGGNLCLNYVLRRTPELAGLIVTGPWIRLAFEAPAIKVAAGRLLRSVWPTLSLPTGLDPAGLSRDPEVVRAYVGDPLVHDKVSASAGIAMLEAASWLNQFSGPAPVPMLLMHGGGDKITSAPATRELTVRLTGTVTHYEWPDMYHEIHNEQEQDQVFEFILDWMNARK